MKHARSSISKRATRARRDHARTSDNGAAAPRTTLAGRIAFLRKQRALTLDDLASVSGLTKSYLSKVERGLSVPSISTAMKLAASFDLSVGQLLGEDQYDDAISVVRRTRRPSFMRAGSSSGYDYEMLAAGKRFKSMEPFVMRPPLAFQDGRRFEHAGQEMICSCSPVRSSSSSAAASMCSTLETAPISTPMFRTGRARSTTSSRRRWSSRWPDRRPGLAGQAGAGVAGLGANCPSKLTKCPP